MEAVTRNGRGGEKSIRLFEIGRTFSPEGGAERESAAIVLSGPVEPARWRGGVNAEADFFHVKGLVERLLGEGVTFRRSEASASFALRAVIELANQAIGTAGQLWPEQARAVNASAPV